MKRFISLISFEYYLFLYTLSPPPTWPLVISPPSELLLRRRDWHCVCDVLMSILISLVFLFRLFSLVHFFAQRS